MRRLVPVVALAAAALLSGCFHGGDDKAEGPLGEALSYLPSDTGAVAVLSTNLEAGQLRRLDDLGSRLESWDRITEELESAVAGGLDFEREVRPQLGNPLVLGLGGEGDRLIALSVRDPAALGEAVERGLEQGGRVRLSDYKGAIVSRKRKADGGPRDFFALHDQVILSARSEQQIKDAIDRSGGSDNLASDEATALELGKLGDEALLRVVGDAQRLIGAGDTADVAAARKIRWVRALGDFAAVANVAADGVDASFDLKTDRETLTDRDLPLRLGSAAPRLHDPGTATAIAVLEPERPVRFAEAAVKAVNPESFTAYEVGVGQLRTGLGVDLHRDLLGRITSLSVAVGRGRRPRITFQARLRNAPAFARTLDRAQRFVRELFGGSGQGVSVVRQGRGTGRVYIVRLGRGELARFAVRDGALVGAISSKRLPRPVRGRPIEGSEGALALKVDLTRLVELAGFGLDLSRRRIEMLSRDVVLTMGVRAETDALTGRAQLELRDPGQ